MFEDLLTQLGRAVADTCEEVSRMLRRALVEADLRALTDHEAQLDQLSPGVDTSLLEQGIVMIRNLLKGPVDKDDVNLARAIRKKLLGNS